MMDRNWLQKKTYKKLIFLFFSVKTVESVRCLTKANNSSEWIVFAYAKFLLNYLVCLLTPVLMFWLIDGGFDPNHLFHPIGIT